MDEWKKEMKRPQCVHRSLSLSLSLSLSPLLLLLLLLLPGLLARGRRVRGVVCRDDDQE